LFGVDFEMYLRPVLTSAREAFWRSGELPRWNPGLYAGNPSLGNYTDNLYYPPNWLNLVLPAEETYELLVFLHLLLAAGGMYRFLRFFRLGRPACVLAGIAYSVLFSFSARMWAGHYHVLVNKAQAPLLLFLLLRVLESPRPARVALLGAGVAAVLLGGHPQYIAHLALLAGAMAAVVLVQRVREGKPCRTRVAAVLAAGLWGAALSAVHLLPALDVAAHSTRAAQGGFYAGVRVPTSHALGWADLTCIVAPAFPWTEGAAEVTGRNFYWHEESFSVGVLPLLLAGVAVARVRNAIVYLLAAASLLSLLAAMPEAIPSTRWLTTFPGAGSFRIPARLTWITELGLVALAGFGWESLPGFGARATRWALFVGGAAALGAFQALGLFFAIWLEAGFVLTLAALSLSLIAVARRWPTVACLGGLALAGGEGCFYGLHLQNRVDRSTYESPPWYASLIPEPRGDYRVLDMNAHGAVPTAHGFRVLRGYGFPVLAGTHEALQEAWSHKTINREDVLRFRGRLTDPDVLRRFNVRWIVQHGEPLHPGWREIGRRNHSVLYEDPAARPRAFPAEPGSGKAALEEISPHEFRLRCSADRETSFVVSEAWMPGWRAYLEGKALPVGRARAALLEVRVPAGSCEVVLVYDPRPWRLGQAISLAGLVLGLAALAWPFLRRLRERFARPPPGGSAG
jgi:hypothetical protein